MYLIQLDLSNVVVSRRPLDDYTTLPINVKLNDTFVITPTPAAPGHVYDPDTQTFSTPTRQPWITKLAFDSRFTMQEAVALKLAQSMPVQGAEETNEAYQARCITAASVQVLQSRLNMASYIDLSRADTRGGVQSLEAMGLIGEGRALEILDGPIAEHMYHPTA